MIKVSKTVVTTLFVGVALLSASSDIDGRALFTSKCSSCHKLNIDDNNSIMTGPMATGLMFHLSQAFKTKD